MGVLARGLIAGAAGTVALRATTYGDMLLRGRAASELPERAVDQLFARLRMPRVQRQQDVARRSAVAALLGQGTGLAIGVGYAVVRGWMATRPGAGDGAVLALVAMAVTNIPMTAHGLTRPTEWSRSDWAADVLPHLAYGWAAVAAARQS